MVQWSVSERDRPRQFHTTVVEAYVIGLCLIATRKYDVFLRPLLKDVYEHFFPNDDLTVYLFTDQYHTDLAETQPYISRFMVEQFPVPSYGFPEATLMRFDMFTKAADNIRADVVYFMDVDMNIVADIGPVALPTDDMVGVHHARCWSAEGTWETRKTCRAFTPQKLRKIYYAGGFFGGFRDSFLSMSRLLAGDISRDIADGITAIWHDESHLNRYFAFHPPKILDPTYCFPPNPAPELFEFTEPKIVCIIKDKEIRSWK